MFDNSTHTFTSLECKKHVKYLGILLDSNLSWKFLIEYVALEISKIIGVIARLRHFVPLCTFLNIYCSLIFPYMPWFSCLGQGAKTHLQKLLVLQKRKTCPSFKVFFWAQSRRLVSVYHLKYAPHKYALCRNCFFFNVWRLTPVCPV